MTHYRPIGKIIAENVPLTIDIPNGYISGQNGMFHVFVLNSAQKVGRPYARFLTLIKAT